MTITPGSPTWIDLGTTDLESAMAFYRDLFGWNFTTTGPDFGNYQMVDVGVPVGGAALNMDMEGNLDTSMPPWFTVYLKVADIEQTLRDVAANGGSVHVPAMPIGDMGSMAIVAAPSGAAFGLWQDGSFTGFTEEDRPGVSIWYESMTRDFDADAAFYAAALGWENTPMGDASGDGAGDGDGAASDTDPGAAVRYVTNFPGREATAGLCEANAWLPEGTPSYWRVYFRVEDTDSAAARIVELGGRVLDGPIDSPFGRLATVADPQGATFQIIQA